jgi:uncharacterized protein YbjT (DUF2867 family)
VGVVAVTGATGFLGRHLVRALANDGWKPRVLVRRDPIHPLWRDIEIEVVTGDLKTPARWIASARAPRWSFTSPA